MEQLHGNTYTWTAPKSWEKVLGIGSTGIVIQEGDYAVKIPQLSREVDGQPSKKESITIQDIEFDRIESIDEEKTIYSRIGGHPCVVNCYSLSYAERSIRMDLMQNGDLKDYLAQNRPEKSTQLSWFI